MCSSDNTSRGSDRPLRVYIDASVFGGCFDDEFSGESLRFFDGLLSGRGVALISDILVAELMQVPEAVQGQLRKTLSHACERLALDRDIQELHNAYLKAGILSEKWSDDALHVAHATVARADVVVSWNFKHLVNPARIRGFNGVNTAFGFGPIVIMTPSDLAFLWSLENHDEEI